MPLLDVQHLNVEYRTQGGVARAVRDVSFAINPGEVYGLVGESGCGKSTTALAVMRYLPPNAHLVGQMMYRDLDLVTAAPRELTALRGNRIAMVYQDPQASLNPVLTISEQLTEVVIAHTNDSRAAARQRAIEMLERVHMPEPAYQMRRYPHQLSGGMQQRVVIAMALILRPELVVMDEPTTGLDVTIEAGVIDLVNELRHEFNMAVLFISHNLGVIAQICDRVGVMYAGEIVEQASVRDLFRDPQHPYTVNLLNCVPQRGARYTGGRLTTISGRVPSLTHLPPGCAFAPRCHFADATCKTLPPELLPTREGHLARCFHWDQSQQDHAKITETDDMASVVAEDVPLLQVDDLHVYYQQSRGLRRSTVLKVVDGVSFKVGQGRTLGMVGESGCGKSTIAGAIAGLKPVTRGRVDFAKRDFTVPIERRDIGALRQLQMVFQNPDSSLNPRHTVEQILTRPLRCFNVVPRDQERQRIIELLHMVNLDEDYLKRKPRQLSGGEKQRVAIARAFAGNPLLVVCDEPISSLDVSVQAAVINLLQTLQKEHKVSLLFIAHDLNMVRYLSDDIVVLYLGKICEIGAADKVFAPPYHPYTEALVSAIPDVTVGAQSSPIRLQGSVPSPANPPTGCRFHTRCPRKIGRICEVETPPGNVAEGKIIYCHIPLEELRELQQPPASVAT